MRFRRREAPACILTGILLTGASHGASRGRWGGGEFALTVADLVDTCGPNGCQPGLRIALGARPTDNRRIGQPDNGIVKSDILSDGIIRCTVIKRDMIIYK